MAEIPAALQDPAVLGYIAALLATGHRYQPGDPIPDAPASLNVPLEELLGYLDDPEVRGYVARRLSVLARPPTPMAQRRARRKK